MSILSKRLTAVAEMVTPGLRVADIGCDHAYLSIHLVRENISPYIIASDVNKGPLEIARNNIIEYGYSDRIDLRLGNGLSSIKSREVDSVVIAGMGGRLIAQILDDGKNVLDGISEVVMGPQSELPYLRHYLEDNDFAICEENMVIDEGKYYTIIKAIRGNMKLDDDMYYTYGEKLISSKSLVLSEYLNKQRVHYLELIKHIERSGQNLKTEKRLDEIKYELELCERALSVF